MERTQTQISNSGSSIVSGLNRRRFERKAANVSCALVASGEHRGRRGRLRDVSAGGAAVAFRYVQSLEPGEIVTLCVNLPLLKKVHFVDAIVVWTKTDWSQPEPFAAGLRFLNRS